MKNILLLFTVLFFVGCQNPTGGQTPTVTTTPPTTTPTTPVTTPPTSTPTVTTPTYVPPAIDGTKSVTVLRYPSTASRSIAARGAIAQADPLIASCNVPGSIYMFYDDNALVQYVPLDGTYTMFSLACKGDVEAHNALNPGSLWDIVTVSMPGPVFDLSHDPTPIVLRIRFLNNDGTDHLFSGQEVNMIAADPAEYATWVYADGSPRPITKQTFGLWGAEDGHSVIHMQLGGDGVSIPPATFHY